MLMCFVMVCIFCWMGPHFHARRTLAVGLDVCNDAVRCKEHYEEIWSLREGASAKTDEQLDKPDAMMTTPSLLKS